MYSLPKTGFGMALVGGVAIARPLLAVGVAVLLIAAGVTLRLTGRRQKIAGR